MKYTDPENWRQSEINNRKAGFLDSADRCRERADFAERNGYQMPEIKGISWNDLLSEHRYRA